MNEWGYLHSQKKSTSLVYSNHADSDAPHVQLDHCSTTFTHFLRGFPSYPWSLGSIETLLIYGIEWNHQPVEPTAMVDVSLEKQTPWTTYGLLFA